MRTFGTAKLREETIGPAEWALRMEPHVSIRFKRVFPQVRQGLTGDSEYCLTATEENCRELEWFMQRFPLQVDPPNALERLARGARAFDKRADLAQTILNGTYERKEVAMQPAARPYQEQAAVLCHHMGGLLVADDLGLGKTVTGIRLIADADHRPAVCVVPTHLQSQWKEQVERFLPGLGVHIAEASNPDYLWALGKQESLLDPRFPPDVLILNYHKLAGWQDVLARGIFKTVVFDEVQELRHAESHRYVAARALSRATQWRLGLSHTPIYNYGAEFFNVVDILRPEALGDRQEFARAWCGGFGGDKGKIGDPRAFGTMLREQALMIRRTRADVGRELPPLSNIIHEFEPNHAKLAEIQGRAAEVARVFLDADKGFDKLQAAQELDALLRLYTGLAKAPQVAAFVRAMIEETGEPVVLFGWHRAVYDLWAEALKDLNPAWYTGTETPKQKDAAKQRFLTGETKLLIISLRSGAGLDGLQAICHRAVFGELDWSPGVHEQCAGRVHRDGQAEPTMAFYLVATAGADPIMVDVLGVKRGQIEHVRDPNAEAVIPKEVDPAHMTKLARAILGQPGEEE